VRFSESQITAALQRQEHGEKVADICYNLGTSVPTDTERSDLQLEVDIQGHESERGPSEDRAWQYDYSHFGPHKALGYDPLAEALLQRTDL
jgi:hypothetical protein